DLAPPIDLEAAIDLPPVAEIPEPIDEPDVEEEFATNRQSSDEEFIDLGEWRDTKRQPQSTRMIAHDEEPEDNEQKDFAEMLDKFKVGLSRNVDEEDFESHYDL